LFSDFDLKALKTGMLLNKEIIKCTSSILKKYNLPKIIDPVMVSRSGAKLLEEDAIEAYKELLIPQAELLTPNIFEASLLSDIDIKSKGDIEKAADCILKLGLNAVLIKGGGLESHKGKDFFCSSQGTNHWFCNQVVNTKNTHGSGCTLSAAICGYRGLGFSLFDSINKAKLYIQKALKKSYKVGSGPGPLGHFII